MKKIVFAIALMCITALSAFSQTHKGDKSLLLELGYKTDFEQFMLGGEFRYGLTNNLRLAPDLQILFPKDHFTGLDVNVNVHYLIPLQSDLTFYPLAGLNIANERFSYKGYDNSSTELGLNLGMGLDYKLSANSHLNAQFKYIISDWDCAVFSLGYGFAF